MNAELDQFARFLQEAAAVIPPETEPTIFGVAGSGHYENPTSDLLAFFLRVNGPHGFGDLFLRAFLECAGFSEKVRRLEWVTVSREETVKSGGRIDLFVQGPDWCLVIETKIYHAPNNPFDEYEEYAYSTGKNPVFAILSPEGASLLPNDLNPKKKWTGVSFGNYCARLRQLLGEHSYRAPLSKWHVFAREFILHLENELYAPTMEPQTAALLEENATTVRELKRVLELYSENLRTELVAVLKPHANEPVEAEDQKWAIRLKCKSWGSDEIAFCSPLHKDPRDDRFHLCVFTTRLNPEVRSQHVKALAGFSAEPRNDCWSTDVGFVNRAEATAALIRLAKLLVLLEAQNASQSVAPAACN